MAQVVWEDFPGRTSIGLADPTITNRYPNNTPPASLNALKTFSNNAANSVRSGTSATFTYPTQSATLCDITATSPNGGANSPPCLRDVMGRVMWARIQFPEAGNYNFSLTHDDEVDIDISSNYGSNSYKSISYNLGVGELASYTSGDTAYEALPGTVYAPVANSCGWIRVYWNNAGGINHLQLRWTRPNGTTQFIPAANLLPYSTLPSSAQCAAAVTSSATSVQLLKQLGSNGRANAADQFSISINRGSTVAAGSGTAGSSIGMVADTGAVLATVGTTYTLTETMLSGSVSPLARYNPAISCSRNGVPFAATAVSTGVWTVTPTAANQQFVCTILNQRNFIPPVAVADVSNTAVVGTPVTINPLANDGDTDGTLVPTTVILSQTGAPTGSSLSSDGKRLVVPGQGIWQVNASTGAITFTPETGYAGNPTPISYQVSDNDAMVSNLAPVTITYIPQSDLALTKSVTPATANVGAPVTFTLTVSNLGLSPATGVVVTDQLPAGYSYLSDSASGAYVAASGLWTVGNLAVGQNRSLTITATVNATGPYVNSASVTGAQSDPVPANNSASASVTPTPVSDLQITKSYDAATPPVGSTVNFTLLARNLGPSAATNVQVSDLLPAGYSYVSDTGAGSYVSSSGLWTIGSLANGASTTLTIAARVNATGPYDNSATISGSETDPVVTNNSSTATPLPVPVADLAVVKTIDTATPNVGDMVTFTLNVTNNGPSAASNVRLNDLLPPGYSYVSDSGLGDYAAGTGIWAVGNLPVGTSHAITIMARVNATGPYLNSATVSGTETDPVASNNFSSVDAQPVAVADLEILKTVSDGLPNVGDQVTFTLRARNIGPSDATEVVVRDLLPAAYRHIANSGGGSYDVGDGIWRIGNLAIGATASLEITVEIGVGSSYVNTATISGAQSDPVLFNNSASVTPGPVPRADLYITKTASTDTPRVGDTVTFTLVAGNNGISPATNVVSQEFLPSGFTFVSASGGTYDPDSGLWTIGDLAQSQTRTLTLLAQVNAAGDYTNSANVQGNEADPNSTNNRSTVTLSPVAQADLVMQKTIDQPAPPVGGTVTFSLGVTNAGPSTATAVEVADLLPAGYRYVSHDGPGSYDSTSGVWSLGQIQNGQTATLQIVAQVQPEGPYLNTATVSAAETDPVPANNTATVTTTPEPQADLVVGKTADNATPDVGGTVTFTIAVANNGPSDATDVEIFDLLPSGYSYVSDDGGTAYDPQSGLWSLGDMAKDATRSLRIVARVNAAGGYTNTANVSAVENDPMPENNTSSTTPVPVAQSDLRLAKSIDVPTPDVGSTVTFTLLASNAGPSDATGVTVQEALPDGYGYVSHSGTGSYAPATGLWSIGTLANGAAVELQIQAVVRASGNFTNSARVSGNETDPLPENNEANVTPTPVQVADLTLVKLVDTAQPQVGSTVEFTLNLRNNGPSAASNVTVSDLLPAGYSYVSDNAGGSYLPSSGIWTIGDLANAATRSVTIRASVNAAGSYANTASVTATERDPDPANNTSTVTPAPTAVADLAIAKTVDQSQPSVGDVVRFTLTAANIGPSAATGVRVLDPLPSGYSYVSDNGGGAYDTGTGFWTIGALASGQSATLVITASVLSEGNYVNTAQISGNEIDPQAGNNTASVAPGPIPSADLSIVKAASSQSPAVGTQVTFTLTASNAGPSVATLVEAVDVLPAGFGFVSATGNGRYDAASGNWQIGSLARGGSAILRIVAVVNASGSYTNSVRVQGREPDPNFANNTSSITLTPVPQTDLAVVKSSSSASPNVGDELRFTILATNNGPSLATLVRVSEALPAGYSYLGHSGPGNYASDTGIWDIGSLASGASETLILRVRVNPTGPYGNSVVISGLEEDPAPANNRSNVTPVPVPVADLAITKTIDVAAPLVGQTVTFTLSAQNNGPSVANTVTVEDLLPAGYSYVSSSASAGRYDRNSGIWTIGSMELGASSSLSIVALVNASGPYLNSASISGRETDPLPANNSASVTPAPVAQADLAITKSVDTQTPDVGGVVTFRLRVVNNGPSDATEVQVTENLPAGYSYLSHLGTGSYSPGTGLWQVAALANGDSAELDVQARVNATGPYDNSVRVSATQSDPNPTNNAASVTPVPQAQADLLLRKSVSTGTPNVGDQIRFQLDLSNLGPSTATAVRVSEWLPAGYGYVSSSGNGSYDPASGIWSVADLPPSANAQLQIIAQVNASGPYQNTATASATENDPVAANNTSSVTPVPVAQSDLAVVKTVNDLAPRVGDTVNFTVNVTNNGPSDATAVEMRDLLPDGYILVSHNGGTTYDATSGIWNVGALINGASRGLLITARVNPTGTYINSASVNGAQADPDPSNNSDAVTPLPVAQTDLSIVKTVDNEEPEITSTVIFTLVARNDGPSDATGVVVTERLPEGYRFISSNDPDAYDPATSLWQIGDLETGDTRSLQITAGFVAGGPYLNTATITGNETDPVDSNNQSSVAPGPEPRSNLSLAKEVNNPTPDVGEIVTFTITANNAGLSDDDGVSVEDILPSGYSYSSHNSTQGSYDWERGTWTIGRMVAGVPQVLTIMAVVNPTGDYTNIARIQGINPDPDFSNNTASATTTPGAISDLSIVKSANTLAPPVGSLIVFTMEVANNGPSAATGVQVQDLLPTGYAYVSHSGPGQYDPASGAWYLGDLASGMTMSLSITATVQVSGEYQNIATVTGVETDPDRANNEDGVRPVPVLGTLSVVKTADVTTLSQPGVVNYTVELTNTGPTAVPRADLVVSDELNLAGRTVALDLTYRSGDSGADDILSPGEVWVYDARYAVTQADLDAGGTLDNIARASAPQITGTPTSPPAVVTLSGTAGLRVEKTATPAINPQLGQSITYQVRVENTGTLTLTTEVPVDTLTTLMGEARSLTTPLSFNAAESGADALPTILPVGQVQVWDGSYVVTQSDIDAGGLRNSVTAYATAPDATTLDATDSVDTPVGAEPDLLLTKVSSYVGSLVAGTVIDYRVSVENRGNVTLTTATPTDQLTTLAGDPRSLTSALAFDATESTLPTSASQLPVGGTQVWRGSYTLTQADIDAGGLRNIASISATPPNNGPALTAQDDDDIQIASQPDLQLVKTAQPPTSLAVGESVTYEVAVENTGNVTLTTDAPVDLLSAWDGSSRILTAPLTFDAAQSTGGATASALPVGARQIWIGSYVLTQADIDAGGLRNTASITAYPPGGAGLEARDDEEVPITAAPALTVVKTADLPALLRAGEIIGYTIRITNDGNVTLATLAPVDTLSRVNGDPLALTSGPSFDAAQSSAGSSETVLPVGGVQVWVGSYQLTQADVDAGGLRNAVNAQGTAPQGGPPAVDDDEVTTLITAEPAMRLVKTAELPVSLAPGETITYVVAVENTGNVTLAAGQPTDTLTTLAGDNRTLNTPLVFDASRSAGGASDSSIPVDAIQVWTGSYVLTQADIEAGGLRNLADSIGTPPNGGTPIPANGSVDVPVTASPAIEVEKLADLPPATEVGATIAYRVILRNSGNVILSATTPLDELTTLTGDPRSLTGGLTFDAALSSGGASDTLLPVGATQVWTGSYVLTQADLDAGGLRNRATATAIPQRGGAALSEDATVDVAINTNPALQVGKTADQSEITQAGPLGYTITVRNSGNVSFALTDLEVSDTLQTARGPVDLPLAGPQPDGDANGNGRLDPGEELSYRASYAVSLADLESAVTLINTARAQVPTGPVTLTPVESPSVAVRVTPDPASLLVEKLAGVQTAMVGDLVPYSIRLSNSGGMRVSARIRDSLPAGFSYREGSARLDGEAVNLDVAGRNLTLAPVSVGAGQERLLTMNVVIGSSVKPGNHVNRVTVSDAISGAALAPEATATVKVIADPVLQCSTVLGRVFDDRDQNGDMNDNGSERGLPNVRLVAPNGVTILTDEFGRFNVPCAALPRAVGSNYMLKLDERTLPAGYRLTTENPRVVRMTAGMLTRLDFGATLAPLIRVDIGAKAFVRDQNGSDRLRPELDQGLRKLVTEVHRTLGMLRITYVLRSGEPESTARARLTMVEQRLRALWRGQGQYKLNIETLIERKGAQE